MSSSNVRYLVFDIESVADGDLISKTRYAGEGLDAQQAIQKYRDFLMEKYESDFIPYTFQVPVSIVVAKIADDFSLIDLVSLDEPEFRPHVITQHFWLGWEKYKRPTLVSFNGRTFDLPLLELAAFRYGIGLANWFRFRGKTYEQPRNRYNFQGHMDLHEILTNFGASRFNGGLNLAANLIGKPGKMDVQGNMVQDLFAEGKLKEIDNYCRCDVLDTYFVFLRCLVLIGDIGIDREKELVNQTKAWLISESENQPIYRDYLAAWGDWQSPWESQTSSG
ncbi:MAG: 3'-5' exonuclease [Planctomycetota bacterium]|nr:3'-5' exonuclease [Planctomycetota bacterium]